MVLVRLSNKNMSHSFHTNHGYEPWGDLAPPTNLHWVWQIIFLGWVVHSTGFCPQQKSNGDSSGPRCTPPHTEQWMPLTSMSLTGHYFLLRLSASCKYGSASSILSDASDTVASHQTCKEITSFETPDLWCIYEGMNQRRLPSPLSLTLSLTLYIAAEPE